MRLAVTSFITLFLTATSASLPGQTESSVKITDIELLVLMRNFTIGDGDELEFADDQIEKLRKIATDAFAKNNELRKKSAADFQQRKIDENLEGEEYIQEYRKAAAELRKKQDENSASAMKRINEILVPSQIKALRQYAFRSRFRATMAPFKILRIAYQQVGMEPSKLKKASKDLDDIQKRYTREIAKLRQKTLNEIIQSLDEKDAAKVLDLTGKQIFPPIR